MPQFSIIQTDSAPAAIGTYSQAVRVGDLVFISGQIPLDPRTGQMVGDDPKRQIAQAFDNLEAIVRASGGSLASIVKLTVYLTNLADFPAVNEAMGARFQSPFPARAAIGVAALPRGALVEVDAILHL